MESEVDRRDGRATPSAVREALDETVRKLAVSSDELWQRVAAASSSLGRLSRTDFARGDDRRLLDSIRLRVMRLDLASHGALGMSVPGAEASDELLETIAEDILTLRSRTLMRALLDPTSAP